MNYQIIQSNSLKCLVNSKDHEVAAQHWSGSYAALEQL